MSLTFAQILQDFVEDDQSGELLRRIADAYPLEMLENKKIVKLKPRAVEKVLAKLSGDVREICDDADLASEISAALIQSQVVHSVVSYMQHLAKNSDQKFSPRQSITFRLVNVLGECLAVDALAMEVLTDIAAGAATAETRNKVAAAAKCAVTTCQSASAFLQNVLSEELAPESRGALVVLLEDMVTVGSTVRALVPQVDSKFTTELLSDSLGLLASR